MTVLPDDNLAYTLAGVGRRRSPYDTRRSFAERLSAQGADTSPVSSPWQGAARLAQALAGAYGTYKADTEEKQATEDRNTKLAAVMAEQDPQKRIGLLSAIDPEYGARISGQMAVEQAKIDRQTQGLGQVASGYGAPGPTQAGPPSGGGGVNPNNIGNVRPVGASSGFQQPSTLDDGVRLAVNNVRAYPAKFNNGQPMTLVQIGQRWAPVGDGANDPRQWAINVASIGGLDPNQPLDLNDPATAAKFARGVHGAEHGANKAMPVDAYARILTGGPGPQIAQGTADTNGMPPTPSPQGVQSPTMVAQPQIPQRMTPRDMPPQMAAPYIDRLRRGGYGMNPAEAEQRMVADMQRALDVSFENQKLEYQRLQGDYEYRRKRGDAQSEAEQKRRLDAEEHDRRESTKPMNDTQSLAATYADRMAEANAVVAKLPISVQTAGEGGLVGSIPFIGDYAANQVRSAEYQRYQQAKNNFIYSQLRKESGAAIGKDEYVAADRQYFPQPGDSKEVIAQKEVNRQIAVNGMSRSAGPTYRPTQSRSSVSSSGSEGGTRQRISLDGKPL
jgi:hypothetical protein